MFMDIIRNINGIFWGWLVAGILLIFGMFITMRLKFPQIRYFSKLITNLSAKNSTKGGVSGFGALCAAVGAEVGTGSLGRGSNSTCFRWTEPSLMWITRCWECLLFLVKLF